MGIQGDESEWVSGNQGRLRNGFLFIGNWKAVKTFKMRYIVNFVFQNHHLSNMWLRVKLEEGRPQDPRSEGSEDGGVKSIHKAESTGLGGRLDVNH